MNQLFKHDDDFGESFLTLWVESTPEGGKVFTISLTPEALAEVSDYAARNGPDGPLGVLIALGHLLKSSNARAFRVN